MAYSYNRTTTRHPIEQVYDFISDFRHASLWDPRTQSVTKLTDGPIGQGCRFQLRARVFGLSLDLPYEIEKYERPELLVVAGRTEHFEYREQVTFTPHGDGTAIEWRAAMTLRSLLALGNPILSLLYQRIGDDATSQIAAALDRALGPTDGHASRTAVSAANRG
jgi:ligand-binding SRPBCC domain-containing protein